MVHVEEAQSSAGWPSGPGARVVLTVGTSPPPPASHRPPCQKPKHLVSPPPPSARPPALLIPQPSPTQAQPSGLTGLAEPGLTGLAEPGLTRLAEPASNGCHRCWPGPGAGHTTASSQLKHGTCDVEGQREAIGSCKLGSRGELQQRWGEAAAAGDGVSGSRDVDSSDGEAEDGSELGCSTSGSVSPGCEPAGGSFHSEVSRGREEREEIKGGRGKANGGDESMVQQQQHRGGEEAAVPVASENAEESAVQGMRPTVAVIQRRLAGCIDPFIPLEVTR